MYISHILYGLLVGPVVAYIQKKFHSNTQFLVIPEQETVDFHLQQCIFLFCSANILNSVVHEFISSSSLHT